MELAETKRLDSGFSARLFPVAFERSLYALQDHMKRNLLFFPAVNKVELFGREEKWSASQLEEMAGDGLEIFLSLFFAFSHDAPLRQGMLFSLPVSFVKNSQPFQNKMRLKKINGLDLMADLSGKASGGDDGSLGF